MLYEVITDNNLGPTFTVPADTTISKDINCDYDASPAITGLPTDLADNCTPVADLIVNYSDEINPGACDGEVLVNRTWTVTDNCGNSTSQVQLITVADNNEPPTFTVPADTTISKDINCAYDASPAVTGFPTDLADNCTSVANLVVSYSDVVDPGTCGGEEIINRTWTVTDDCGNTASATQIITVVDTSAPVLAGVPADETVECSDVPAAAIPMASDNCDTDVEITLNEVTTPGACGASYTLTRTWTATDDRNNFV